jgi:hypothetical protein
MSAPPATDAVVVPATPLLLPENRSLRDPVAGVRAVAAAAVRWLAERHPERVVVLGAPCGAVDRARGVTRPSSLRVAGSLLEVAGFTGRVEEHAPPYPAAPFSSSSPTGPPAATPRHRVGSTHAPPPSTMPSRRPSGTVTSTRCEGSTRTSAGRCCARESPLCVLSGRRSPDRRRPTSTTPGTRSGCSTGWSAGAATGRRPPRTSAPVDRDHPSVVTPGALRAADV